MRDVFVKSEKCGGVQRKTGGSLFHEIEPAKRERQIILHGIIGEAGFADLFPSGGGQTNVGTVSAGAENGSAAGIPSEKEQVIKH